LALYKEVFFRQPGEPRAVGAGLNISEDFLEQHADVIREKLDLAAAEFSRVNGNIFAINMCLHVASSVILNRPDYLKVTLDRLGSTAGLKGMDPSTVLTVAALYGLIQWDASRAASEKANARTKAEMSKAQDYESKLATLRQGFDAINWLVGKEAMKILEFE
jgi:hypothetical protein